MVEIQTEDVPAILVQYKEHTTGTQRRLWFDETSEGRLVLASVVDAAGQYRSYMDRKDWYVPREVESALKDEFDIDVIRDTKGKPV